MPEDKQKKKKLRHTSLVVPEAGKKKKAGLGKDRLGRSVEGAGPRAAGAQAGRRSRPAQGSEAAGPGAQSLPPTPALPLAAAGPEAKAAAPRGSGFAPEDLARPGAEEEGGLPANAIVLPQRRKKHLTPKKRRRRRRRVQALALLALLAAFGVFYVSGAYVTVAALARDAWDGLRIAASPGEGWPMNLALTDFIAARPLGGGNGFAAVGSRDAVMVDASGKELWRVQHSYMTPGISTGNTRMVVYSRGGTEYSVEGRSSTLATHSTEHEIQFCELSPDGWLAVVTASRYRATLDVYGPAYDAGDVEFHMPLVDVRPVLARFASDNRNLLVGCVAARGGALGSTLTFLHTGRSEVQAEVRADAALLLDAAFVGGGRVVAVYDQFTALYSAAGEELARYSYGRRSLQHASIRDGRVALAFGGSTQETFHAVLLDAELKPLFDKAVTGSGRVRVLASAGGAWLMCGQDVYAYTDTGALAGSRRVEPRTLGLVHGGEALVLASGLAESVEPLLHPESESASDASAVSAVSAASEQPPASTEQDISATSAPGGTS